MVVLCDAVAAAVGSLTQSDVNMYDLDEMMPRTWDIGNLTMEVVNTTTEKTKMRNLVDAMTC